MSFHYNDDDYEEQRRRREEDLNLDDQDPEVSTTQPVPIRSNDPRPPTPPVIPLASGTGGPAPPRTESSRAIIENLSRKYGASVESSDVSNLDSKNPEDRARFIQDLDAQYQRRGSNVPGQPSGPRTGSPPPLQAAYQNYLGSGPDLSAITAQIEAMRAQQQADRERQQQERAAMRELLMGRIGEASKPVDMKAPGIRELLGAQRLSRQRSEERQRSQLAARMSGEGLLDSGAFDTGLSGIQQARGEGESADIAEVMGGELQAKRQELLQLYQMAISMGDAEQARNIQQQMAGVDAELAKTQVGEGARRFDADLGFRREGLGFQRSSFLDNLGLQLMMAQLNANQNATTRFF